MPGSPVLAAARWTTNGHLISDCVRLGYIRPKHLVIDLTYGKGVWWKEHGEPRFFEKHDLLLDGVDFRNTPWVGGQFDVVAFDPPYVSVGGRATSGIKAFYEQYGLMDAPTSPASLQRLINGGLDETWRLLGKGGHGLVKVTDYISSGRLWCGVYWTMEHAMSLGLEPVDLFHMVGTPRQQPERTRKPKIEGGPRTKSPQQHARRNVSTLLVVKKGNFRVESVRRRIQP